jgi:putative membrane protein
MKQLFILGAGLMVAMAAPVFADTHDSYNLKLEDGQIADVVLTASSIAADAARLARSRSLNEAVKRYADEMIGEHENVNDAAARLASKLNVLPQDNPISKSLKMDAAADLAKLRLLSGKAFDEAYIRQKIVLYQHVLDAIDNQLMPNAASMELKTLLYSLFAPFSQHLEHAQQIQEALNESARNRREDVRLQVTGQGV